MFDRSVRFLLPWLYNTFMVIRSPGTFYMIVSTQINHHCLTRLTIWTWHFLSTLLRISGSALVHVLPSIHFSVYTIYMYIDTTFKLYINIDTRFSSYAHHVLLSIHCLINTYTMYFHRYTYCFIRNVSVINDNTFRVLHLLHSIYVSIHTWSM